MGVVGWNGTLSDGTTLTTSVNATRLTTGWLKVRRRRTASWRDVRPIIASESDPSRPLNTLALPGADITPQDKWPGRNEQENALANGLTPLK